MTQPLWGCQPYTDIVYIGITTLLALFLALTLAVPGLWHVIKRAYMYSRTEPIHEYIARYIPRGIYARTIDVIIAGALAILTLEASVRLGVLPCPKTHLKATIYLGVLLLGVLGLMIMRRMHFELWRYVFMPPKIAPYLLQDYLIISLGGIVPLSLCLIMSLTSINPTIWIWGALGTLALMSALRSLQTVRRLHQSGWQDVYIFLYLCTHEFSPWVIALLVAILSPLQILSIAD